MDRSIPFFHQFGKYLNAKKQPKAIADRGENIQSAIRNPQSAIEPPFGIDNSGGGEINFERPKVAGAEALRYSNSALNELPMEKKLEEVGLNDVAEDLKKMGKIEG